MLSGCHGNKYFNAISIDIHVRTGVFKGVEHQNKQRNRMDVQPDLKCCVETTLPVRIS